MTTPTYAPATRVRLTVPGVYADHEGLSRRLGVTMVFRVMSQVGGDVKVVNDIIGRRFVLPASQLTRVG